jgi:nitrate/nitrite transporter NarK
MLGGDRGAGAAEWRAHWTLPLAALIGYSTIGLQSYGIGPFVPHLEQAFGWSRADVMIGVSLSNAVGVFLNILIGMIVDRFGPRRVALTGLLVKTGSFALLATATGSLLNWSLLWAVLAVGVVLVQSTVWISAVAARFDHSRGLAMAVALSGTPITAAVCPVLATWLIGAYDWRVAFVGVAAAWLLVTLPVTFLFFRDPPRAETAAAGPVVVSGLTFREGLRTAAFWRLIVGFGAFSFYNMAMAPNLVPLLGETGVSAMAAAGIASVMGLVGIVARLTVGLLLDRFPGGLIGAVTQFLPVIGCTILLMDNPGVPLLTLAVATFGIATGAEIDTALYLATRHFGLRAFAALFGAVITFGAVNAAIGPYVAGRLHDQTGNYDGLLVTIMVAMTIGALAMLTMGSPKQDWREPSPA